MIALIPLLLCLCGGGIQDWREGRISNIWILAGIAAGSLIYGSRFWVSAIVLLIAGYWLYFFRMMGAGDLKMMALICGFMGIEHGISAIGLSACICGGISIIHMLLSREKKTQFLNCHSYFLSWFGTLLQTKKRLHYYDKNRRAVVLRIPFGSYLCIGTMCYIAWCRQRGGI